MGKAPRKKGAHEWGSKKPQERKKKFITRNQALKYLQVSITDFRRLCILKGIYPREPTKKKGFNPNQTYYYMKDIRFLSHEPLLQKYRELYAFTKKLKKAQAKGEETKAEALEKYAKPILTYDHLIKERYPTFYSALSDLDDCLTLLFMFSKLPPVDKIQEDEIRECAQLCKEFSTYVALSKSLRKVFLSVKGIYYQAVIMGQTITWLVPYDFPQQVILIVVY